MDYGFPILNRMASHWENGKKFPFLDVKGDFLALILSQEEREGIYDTRGNTATYI